MQSIRASVHQLLEDQIQRLGMQGEYEVQKAEIKHRYQNTSFTFHGLRDQSGEFSIEMLGECSAYVRPKVTLASAWTVEQHAH
jgi:hypothetical protein